jgi:hypothetical protein
MNAHPEIPHHLIDALQRQFTTALRNIRLDGRFTTAGRRNAIAAAYRPAYQGAEHVRDRYLTQTAEYRDRLEADLFDLPTDSDAPDRAAAFDDEETARTAYERASEIGDIEFLRAMLLRAVDEGWEELVRQADACGPGTFNKLAEYRALEDIDDAALLAATTIRRPTELDNATIDQITTWADQHQPQPAQPIHQYSH